MYPVKLSADRGVQLREFDLDDTDAALTIVGDPRVTDWLSFDPRTQEEAAAMVAGIMDRAQGQPRDEFYLAIEADDDLVGFARLALSGVRAAKLGYAVAADHWRCGYASAAAGAMLRFAFGDLELHRVSCAVGPDNVASLRMVEKLGFTREGRIRDHVFTNGAWRDSVLFGMLTHEWRQQ